jgi:hypothetical protein
MTLVGQPADGLGDERRGGQGRSSRSTAPATKLGTRLMVPDGKRAGAAAGIHLQMQHGGGDRDHLAHEADHLASLNGNSRFDPCRAMGNLAIPEKPAHVLDLERIHAIVEQVRAHGPRCHLRRPEPPCPALHTDRNRHAGACQSCGGKTVFVHFCFLSPVRPPILSCVCQSDEVDLPDTRNPEGWQGGVTRSLRPLPSSFPRCAQVGVLGGCPPGPLSGRSELGLGGPRGARRWEDRSVEPGVNARHRRCFLPLIPCPAPSPGGYPVV